MQTDEKEPAPQLQPVPFDQFLQDLPAVFDRAASAGKHGVTIEREGMVYRPREMAVARRGQKRRRTITAEDALWDIIGIGDRHSGRDRPTSVTETVTENTDRYLAEACGDLHGPNNA